MTKYKRSQIKKFTRQAEVLRYMRISRRISMRKAGSLNGCSDSAISHYEQGRMEISEERIEQLVTCYRYTMAEFNEYLGGKPIPILSVKDECISLLDRIDEAKLRAVHAVLVGFISR